MWLKETLNSELITPLQRKKFVSISFIAAFNSKNIKMPSIRRTLELSKKKWSLRYQNAFSETQTNYLEIDLAWPITDQSYLFPRVRFVSISQMLKDLSLSLKRLTTETSALRIFNISFTGYNSVRSFIRNLWQVLNIRNCHKYFISF